MQRLPVTFWFVVSVIAFFASAGIHFATYYEVSLTDRWPVLWGVYAGAALFYVAVRSGARERTKNFGKWRFFAAFGPRVRLLVGVVSILLFIYASVVIRSDHWNGYIIRRFDDNRPMLVRRGQETREATEGEVSHHKALDARGYSAYLLAFSTTSALELLSLVLLERRYRATESST